MVKSITDFVGTGKWREMLDFAIKHAKDKASKDYFRQAKKDIQEMYDATLKAVRKAIKEPKVRRLKTKQKTISGVKK